MSELASIQNLYEATKQEAAGLLERVVENNGGAVIKAGSPALAILYAYDELVQRLWFANEAHLRAIHQTANAQLDYVIWARGGEQNGEVPDRTAG